MLTLDHDRHLVYRDGTAVELTPRQFAVLESLLDAHPRVARRPSVFSYVYGDLAEWDQPLTSKSLDVYVWQLRPILERLRLEILSHRSVGWELIDLGDRR